MQQSFRPGAGIVNSGAFDLGVVAGAGPTVPRSAS
ncbi:MAG: hypothetical protein JWQ55_2207 [Rhodopila sp.]|jgi:hypothetical protein|nr:hypothetical protein [Rhodopila sp.]